jgi:hypothetical protein
MKRQLPYIVCGWFDLPYRRLDNFAYIDRFIIDIDHLSEKELDIDALRDTIKKDERVLMMFMSPGNDGLKLMFRLKDKCYDAEMYKLFYRVFANRLSIEYNLEQAIDSRTCDVTRACFVSVDYDAYYNQGALDVDMNNYLDDKDMQSLFDMKYEMDNIDRSLTAIEPHIILPVDPDEEALNYIKQQLSLRKKVVEERQIFVPEILQNEITGIINDIQDTGILVSEVIDIQYGKKIRVILGSKCGEVNVYYGRNGFTIVESPKRGTSEELNSVTADIINAYVQEPAIVQRIECLN